MTDTRLPEGKGNEVNLLRDRTFNDELRGLVHRIERNEHTPTNQPEKELSPKALLQQMHRTWYAWTHFDTSLHDTSVPVPWGNYNTRKDHFLKALAEEGYENPALMTYSLQQRSFFWSSDKENSGAWISLRDPLFTTIMRQGYVTLTRDEIENNYFLEQNLKSLPSFRERSIQNSIQIIALDYIYYNWEDDARPWILKALSPLLTFAHDEKPEQIHESLNTHFSGSARTILDAHLPHTLFPSHPDSGQLFISLDNLVRVFSIDPEAQIIFVHYENYLSTRRYFISRHFEALLTRTLGIGAVYIRLSTQHGAVFTSCHRYPEMDRMVQLFNHDCGDCVTIDPPIPVTQDTLSRSMAYHFR